MKIKDVYEHFGSWCKVSKCTGMSMNTFRNWLKIGYIPAVSQAKLEKHTGGTLKFNVDDLVRDANKE